MKQIKFKVIKSDEHSAHTQNCLKQEAATNWPLRISHRITLNSFSDDVS